MKAKTKLKGGPIKTIGSTPPRHGPTEGGGNDVKRKTKLKGGPTHDPN